MAGVERELGRTIIRRDGQQVYLDELNPSVGNHQDEPNFECSLMCHLAESDMEATNGE